MTVSCPGDVFQVAIVGILIFREAYPYYDGTSGREGVAEDSQQVLWLIMETRMGASNLTLFFPIVFTDPHFMSTTLITLTHYIRCVEDHH